MDLYIIRHAVAHKPAKDRWPDDAKRPLTQRGEERFRRAARGILRLVPEVEAVLSSPFVRAWRTAEILEQAGWPAPALLEELEPDYPPHKVLNALYDGLGSMALVGHRPQLHELVSYLLTGEAIGETCNARPDQERRRGPSLLRRSFGTGRGLPRMVAPAEGAVEYRLNPDPGRLIGQRHPHEGLGYLLQHDRMAGGRSCYPVPRCPTDTCSPENWPATSGVDLSPPTSCAKLVGRRGRVLGARTLPRPGSVRRRRWWKSGVASIYLRGWPLTPCGTPASDIWPGTGRRSSPGSWRRNR